MQTIQLSLDDELSNALLADATDKNVDRAELIREAIRFYLRVRKEAVIKRQYEAGYGSADLTKLALEMKDWEDEQVWPEP